MLQYAAAEEIYKYLHVVKRLMLEVPVLLCHTWHETNTAPLKKCIFQDEL